MTRLFTNTKMWFLCALLCCTAIQTVKAAAKKNEHKFGKVSVEELETNVCPFDSAANAMYIYHDTRMYMAYRTDLVLVTEYRARIKVLTEEGKDEANISIQRYNNKSTATHDNLNSLSATVYNLENGKVVATKLNKDYISEEQVSDRYAVTKIALPNVKAGSVIEYKYELTSPLYYQIPDWYAQRSLPVLTCHCNITIPEYFKFNQSMVGGCDIDFEAEDRPTNFLGTQVNAKLYQYDAENLPGVANEKFVYAPNSYVGSVRYELTSLIIPGQLYKDFASSWDKVREQVLKDSQFKNYLQMNNPFKEEMSGICQPEDKILVKAQKIYDWLKAKVKWNEYYSFTGNNPKNAIKEGKGANSQLNFILQAMYRDAGISCTPLLMKVRSRGPLPLTHATIDELNTFVVAFCDEESNIYFIDGSADFGGINNLPNNLLGEGILLEPGLVSGNHDIYRLSELSGSGQIITNRCTIDPSGRLNVIRRTQYSLMSAQEYRKSLNAAAGDTATFLKDFEQNYGVEVTGFRFNEDKCIETLTYNTPCDVVGEEIYVNAMCTAEEHQNHFTASTRQLPVMFPFKQTEKVTSYITIPAGYELASMPEKTVIHTSDGKITAVFDCKLANNTIQTSYLLDIDTDIVPITQYQELKDFWKKLIDLNNQTIVLKKSSAQ